METTALTLPDETTFRHDIQAINKFQEIVRQSMRENQDYGVIPGTKKPTLLKPGAEKIAKLLGLADYYDILDKHEDWDRPFFRYLIKCRLVTVNSGITISEGLGECNSMESKYRWRWVFPSELPASVDKDKLMKKTINTRNGKAPMYRIDNDDVFSQVNTIIKMAKKRALVDAALSAGRLSEIFTQDVEDMKAEDIAVDNTAPAVENTAPPEPVGEPLATEAQRKKIFAASKQMGYTEDDVRQIMQVKFKVEASKDLTKKQASELIEMIERGEGVEPPPED